MLCEEVYLYQKTGATHGRNVEDCDGTMCGFQVCKNNGQCSVVGISTFQCACPDTYVGTVCDIPVQCAENKCTKGTCVTNGLNGYECLCNIGWTGTYCDSG